MPSALGPAALGLWVYISDKSLAPMSQLLHVLIILPRYISNSYILAQYVLKLMEEILAPDPVYHTIST